MSEKVEKATPPVIPTIPSPPTTPTKVLVRELKREPANLGTECCDYHCLSSFVLLDCFPLLRNVISNGHRGEVV